MMSVKKMTVDLPSSFFIGLAPIHFVNLSTATRRCVMPPRALLNGPTMSRPHTANGHVRGMVLSAEPGVCLTVEKRWHPLHLFTSSSAS